MKFIEISKEMYTKNEDNGEQRKQRLGERGRSRSASLSMVYNLMNKLYFGLCSNKVNIHSFTQIPLQIPLLCP